MPACPLPLAFLGLGDTEILVIMVVVLIFFGGERMPELARGLGRLVREFKKATGEVEREFRRVMDEAEHPVSSVLNEIRDIPAHAQPFTPSPPPPEESADPHVAVAEPESAPALASPTRASPPPSTTHRFRGDGEAEFHSDI